MDDIDFLCLYERNILSVAFPFIFISTWKHLNHLNILTSVLDYNAYTLTLTMKTYLIILSDDANARLATSYLYNTPNLDI